MATLAKTKQPETTKAIRQTAKRKPEKQKPYLASALAGKPIHLPKTSILDIVLEKPLRDPGALLPFLTGYKQPRESDVLKALRGPAGTKVGTVLGGKKASQVTLAAREVGSDCTLRTNRRDVELGEVLEPDLTLTSVVMMGTIRFTSDDAWLVCELAGYDETPEALATRINQRAWRLVNVVEHVPLPVAAAVKDLLRTHGFDNLTVRHAVPRKK